MERGGLVELSGIDVILSGKRYRLIKSFNGVRLEVVSI